MKLRTGILSIAISLAFVSVLATSLGGYIDMMRQPVTVTREHAWNDGIYVILLAIFLLMLANRV